MPTHQLNHISSSQAYLIWHIQESEQELFNKLAPNPAEVALYDHFKHPKRRLEWLAARLAYQLLCKEMNLPYSLILKEASGRPYLASGKVHVSLSHCFPFVVAAISQNAPIGIDIQLPDPALESVGVQRRFLNNVEIKDSGQDIEKLCIYWSAKEAIYKAHGQQELSAQSISIQAFEKSNQGEIYAQALDKYPYQVHYCINPNYILAWCQTDQ